MEGALGKKCAFLVPVTEELRNFTYVIFDPINTNLNSSIDENKRGAVDKKLVCKMTLCDSIQRQPITRGVRGADLSGKVLVVTESKPIRIPTSSEENLLRIGFRCDTNRKTAVGKTGYLVAHLEFRNESRSELVAETYINLYSQKDPRQSKNVRRARPISLYIPLVHASSPRSILVQRS